MNELIQLNSPNLEYIYENSNDPNEYYGREYAYLTLWDNKEYINIWYFSIDIDNLEVK